MGLWERLTGGVYTIAEMSANHGGKLENALQIVREAKKAGADCLKIQTYTADTLTIKCDSEYFRIKGGLWDGYTLYDLYTDASTPWEWQEQIKRECDREGLDFLSTPFDTTSVDFLERLGVEFYKIASFELVDIPLIEYAAAKGKPMLISCGMGSVEDIRDALDACARQKNDRVILLKCCSEYPAQLADMNLAAIGDMKTRFGVPVGFSDHTIGSLSAVVAVSLGACVVEKHFCLSRSLKTPDSEFSTEPKEFSDMVSDMHDAGTVRGRASYELTDGEKNSLVFRRSLFAVEDIKQGELIRPEQIRSIRPGYGIKPKYLAALVGTPAARDYRRGEPIGKSNEHFISDK